MKEPRFEPQLFLENGEQQDGMGFHVKGSVLKAPFSIRRGERHTRRGGPPHEVDFLGREAIGGVDEIGEAPLQRKGFGGRAARGLDRVGVLLLQPCDVGGRQLTRFRQGLASASTKAVTSSFSGTAST